MSLRTKLLTAFTLMTLLPFIAGGLLALRSAQRTIVQNVAAALDGIAQVQVRRAQEIMTRYLDQAQLITFRTQLQRDIAAYSTTPTPALKEKISRILQDAQTSVSDVTAISIVDTHGTVILSTSPLQRGTKRTPEILSPASAHVAILSKNQNNVLQIQIISPFSLKGHFIGFVEILYDPDKLIALTEDYTGLGDTGEVFIVEPDTVRNAVYLTPLRFDSDATLRHTTIGDAVNVPLLLAISGRDTILTGDGIIDYRGRPVFAATRSIHGLGWGLVAKIDRDEALIPATDLGRNILIGSIIAVLLVILVFYLLARMITHPIEILMLATKKMQRGDLSTRTIPSGPDEIGQLGRAFNEMAGELEKSQAILEQRVEQKTIQLREEVRNVQKFQQAVEVSTDAIAITLPNLEYVYVNSAWEHLTGYSQQEILGNNPQMILSDETNLALTRKLLNLPNAEEEVTFHSDFFIHKRKDGSEYNAEMSVYPIKENGKTVFRVLIHRDITQRTRENQAKSEFVSLASHQLGTPLTKIRWALSSIAREVPFDAEHRKTVQAARDAVTNMSETIRAMLTIAHIESYSLPLQASKVAVRGILDASVNLLEAMRKKRGIRTILHCPETLYLHTDEQLLKEILSNLLGNAYKYTPNKGTVTIQAEQSENCIRIEVSDTGFGIPLIEQGRIFRKFFRATNITKKDEAGSGLGLYLVYSLVRLLGGDISFVSKENVGTTFTLLFPSTPP